jgi:hypothetical protein
MGRHEARIAALEERIREPDVIEASRRHAEAMWRELVPSEDWRYLPPGPAKDELMASGRWYYAKGEDGTVEGRYARFAPPWTDPYYDIAFKPDGTPATAAETERMDKDRRVRWARQ